MVEVIHEHDARTDDGSNGISLLIGIILAVAVILFLFYYFGQGLNLGGGNSQINIPDRVNVDVNQNPK